MVGLGSSTFLLGAAPTSMGSNGVDCALGAFLCTLSSILGTEEYPG
jgi:hypothetical protein